MKTPSQEVIFDDMGLADRVHQAQPEQGPVRTVLFEARDIIMGGIDLLRQRPVGSIEVGGAIAAAGVALGAVIVPRLRHSH